VCVRERRLSERERKLRETCLGGENEIRSICGTHGAKRLALVDKIMTLERLALQDRGIIWLLDFNGIYFKVSFF
jgi:hypothetical protein